MIPKLDDHISWSFPQSLSHLNLFLTSENASEGSKADKYHDSKLKRFAYILKGYIHLHIEDMINLFQIGGVLTEKLKKHLSEAYNKCTSCRQVGRPHHSRKVSFKKVFSTFNDRVQMGFFYVTDMGKNHILHIVDTSTGYSETRCVIPSLCTRLLLLLKSFG